MSSIGNQRRREGQRQKALEAKYAQAAFEALLAEHAPQPA